MADDQKLDEKARREAFEKHLEEASEIVRSWPPWKRSLLGAPPIGPPSKPYNPYDPETR